MTQRPRLPNREAGAFQRIQPLTGVGGHGKIISLYD